MAQTTNYEIANSSGLVFRGRVNEVFAAVQSNNSGATEPTGTVAYQLWYDTTTNTLKMRNASNSDWINLFTLDQTNSVWSVNANSTSDALRITQTGTGNALLVEDSANPDSTPFVITAAGDVGIGTTTPTNTLTVNGTIGGTIVATQAEAEAGTDTTKLMTPLRVAQAIGGKSGTDYQVFPASGTWTKPANAPAGALVIVELWGGGGGGSRVGGNNYSGGGGGGAFSTRIFRAGDLGATESVSVGAGGSGRTASAGSGGNGGNSSFGSLITAYGGGGGIQQNTSSSVVTGGGGGGQLSAASTTTAGEFGGGGGGAAGVTVPEADLYGGAGGGAGLAGFPAGKGVYGGGGGGGYSSPTNLVQAGGISKFAGAGGASSTTATGGAGTAPAGGGGSGVNQNGGNGARGEVRVYTTW